MDPGPKQASNDRHSLNASYRPVRTKIFYAFYLLESSVKFEDGTYNIFFGHKITETQKRWTLNKGH